MRISPREGVLLGANLGRAIITNGDFNGVRVRQCRDAALLPNYFGQICYYLHHHHETNHFISCTIRQISASVMPGPPACILPSFADCMHDASLVGRWHYWYLSFFVHSQPSPCSLRPISWNLTTQYLTVTDGGCIGKCGRLSQSS